jgi:hypothetical protein
VTQSLRGLADAGPMHWRADRTAATPPDGAGFEDARRAFLAFRGAFDSLLGKALSEDDMQLFADFALTLRYPPNPIRSFEPPPPGSDFALGEQLFRDELLTGNPQTALFTCNECHALPTGTNGKSHDDLVEQNLKVAHLRNLYQKVGAFTQFGVAPKPPQVRGFGYVHDGDSPSLDEFLRRPAFRLSDDQLRQMLEFMLSFDTGLAPIVGQQVTFTPATRNAPELLERLTLFTSRADAGDCDLIAKGNLATSPGVRRGFVYAGGDSFRSDVASDPPTTSGALRAAFGDALTITAVPPGSGTRMGVDRDRDGALDEDERRSGTNPADASDF